MNYPLLLTHTSKNHRKKYSKSDGILFIFTDVYRQNIFLTEPKMNGMFWVNVKLQLIFWLLQVSIS